MSDKYETGECRKFTFWVVYDTTGDRQFVKMDSDTGCLAIFDVEARAAAFASDLVGVDYREVVLYQLPPETSKKPEEGVI